MNALCNWWVNQRVTNNSIQVTFTKKYNRPINTNNQWSINKNSKMAFSAPHAHGFFLVRGIESRHSHRLGKCSANWATSPVSHHMTTCSIERVTDMAGVSRNSIKAFWGTICPCLSILWRTFIPFPRAHPLALKNCIQRHVHEIISSPYCLTARKYYIESKCPYLWLTVKFWQEIWPTHLIKCHLTLLH